MLISRRANIPEITTTQQCTGEYDVTHVRVAVIYIQTARTYANISQDGYASLRSEIKTITTLCIFKNDLPSGNIFRCILNPSCKPRPG